MFNFYEEIEPYENFMTLELPFSISRNRLCIYADALQWAHWFKRISLFHEGHANMLKKFFSILVYADHMHMHMVVVVSVW